MIATAGHRLAGEACCNGRRYAVTVTQNEDACRAMLRIDDRPIADEPLDRAVAAFAAIDGLDVRADDRGGSVRIAACTRDGGSAMLEATLAAGAVRDLRWLSRA